MRLAYAFFNFSLSSVALGGCQDPERLPLFINEVAAAGVALGDFNPGGSDWVELYNAGDRPIVLDGFRFDDEPGDFAGAEPLPAKTLIAPKGFLVVFFNRDREGVPAIGKALGSDEEVLLYHRRGMLIDHVDWSEADAVPGQSYGRSPDGGSTFVRFLEPTPNQPNSTQRAPRSAATHDDAFR